MTLRTGAEEHEKTDVAGRGRRDHRRGCAGRHRHHGFRRNRVQRAGDCWHARDHYDYAPRFGVVVHDDNWRWRDRDHYRWREHDGRGYWRNGIWLSF